jgi:hypothetical protein
VAERVNQARVLYERVVFTGEAGLQAEADRELDAAEADLAVARGRLIHTRFQLRREEGSGRRRGRPRGTAAGVAGGR